MTEGGLWHSACWELIQFSDIYLFAFDESHTSSLQQLMKAEISRTDGASRCWDLLAFPTFQQLSSHTTLQATRTICSFWDHFRITYQQIFPLEGSVHTSVHTWIRIESVKWPPSDLMSLSDVRVLGNVVRWDHTHTRLNDIYNKSYISCKKSIWRSH